MSVIDTPTPAAWSRRSPADLLEQQLDAMTTFLRAQHAAEETAAAGTRTREMRMDSARRLDVLRRQHAALVARTAEQLRESGDVLRAPYAPRAVLAHRSTWFVDRVADQLDQRGVRVVARTDNGADAVGMVVAEACDLVLVEDALAMVPGEQVVEEIRRYCPATIVAAQVAHGDRVGAFLAAGAAAVVTRQVPPAGLADRLAELLTA